MTKPKASVSLPLALGFLLLIPGGARAQEASTLRQSTVPSLSAVSPEATAVQNPPALRLVPVLTDGSVRVEFENLLGSVALRRSLEGGLPVRIRLVVELWRDRFFDAQEGRVEWRATVHHDPLTESFRVEDEDGTLRYVDSLSEAGNLLESWVSVPLRPPVSGRYYYLGRVEIETLSLSDLDELRRWLQGDLAPAMDEGEPVGGAVGRGVRRIVVRVLGLPTQRHEARSAAFEWSR
jgi:hypothetical protein